MIFTDSDQIPEGKQKKVGTWGGGAPKIYIARTSAYLPPFKTLSANRKHPDDLLNVRMGSVFSGCSRSFAILTTTAPVCYCPNLIPCAQRLFDSPEGLGKHGRSQPLGHSRKVLEFFKEGEAL